MKFYYRFAIMLALLAIDKVLTNVGYVVGFVAKSIKEGHRDGRSDREYNRHREFLRSGKPNVTAPREPWNVVVNRCIKRYQERKAAGLPTNEFGDED